MSYYQFFIPKFGGFVLYNDEIGFKLTLGTDYFNISWNSHPNSVSLKKIVFNWRGFDFKLTAIGKNNERSTTVEAILEFNGIKYKFGIGRCSVGAGCIGVKPKILVGNNNLNFSFGKNYIHVENKVISSLIIK